MEVYILDSLLRREVVVDRFTSLIWTERHKEIGEFELILISNQANRSLFISGKRIVHNDSVRVMTVETVEDITDDQGRKLLKVKGRSIEAVLEDRSAISPAAIMADQNWTITGTPENVARTMYTDICITGTLDPGDVIPFQGSSDIFPEDTIPESVDSITWYQKPATLYAAIKEVCDIYDLGFRLVRNPNSNLLRFDVYTGNDRTVQQNILDPVIFSPELENLENTSELTTIEKTKNVAYVTTIVDDVYYFAIVYAPNVDPETEGFERRVLTIEVSLEDDEALNIPLALERRGLDELAKHQAFTAFDGEITQTSKYKYGVDYFLGDLVEMQNSDGYLNNMRVTEQIFVSDAEGDRAYPTLSFNMSIDPGAWLAQGFRVWEDMGLSEYWSNQP